MKRLGYFIIISWLFCGCTLPREVDKDTVLREEKLVYESSLPETERESEEGEAYSEPVAAVLNKGTPLSDDKKAELMRQQQDLYAFSTLEVTQQNLYVEMLHALTNYVEEMQVSTLDTTEIDKIFQCVLLDHPEIFYADGYSFVKYTLGDEVNKITFSGTYIYDWEEKAAREAMIEETVEEIIQGISPEASDYEKVKYVYETIINRTEYVKEAEDNQNICSVFIGNRSVCQGYAKAAQYLLQKLGVPASLVTGTVENGEGHAWNLVRIDNAYYYVDTTWGDASYLFQGNEADADSEHVPGINYDYLCVTTQELLKTHDFNDLIPLPSCTAVEANYYVREGAYFQALDSEQLKSLIARYQAEGRENVTLKCADEAVYEEILYKLLEEQEIFEYLQPENNSILYTNSPRQCSITFWLS